MTANTQPQPPQHPPDQTAPGTEDPRPAAGDAVTESIRAWAENAERVEAIKAARRAPRETASALDDLHRLRALGMEGAERNERQARGLLTMAEQDAAARCDTGLRFAKLARAVRQIIVLEQELMGLRAPPEGRAASDRTARALPAAEARPSPGASRHPLPQAGEGSSDERDDTPERSDLRDRERSDLRDRERSDLRDRERSDLYDYDDGPMEQVLAGLRKVVGDHPADGGRKAGTSDPPERDGRRRTSPDGFAAAGSGLAEAVPARERGPP